MVDNADELNQLGQAARRFFNPGPTPIIWPRQQPASPSAPLLMTAPATPPASPSPTPDSVPVDRRRSATWALHQTQPATAQPVPAPPVSTFKPNGPVSGPSQTAVARPTAFSTDAFRSSPTDKLIPELPGSIDRQILVAGLLAGALFLGFNGLVSSDRFGANRASTPVASLSSSASDDPEVSSETDDVTDIVASPDTNSIDDRVEIPVQVAGTSVDNPNANPNTTGVPTPTLGSTGTDDSGFLLPTIPIPPEITGQIGVASTAPNVVFAPNQNAIVPTTVGAPLLTLDPGPNDPLIFEQTKPFN